MSPLRSYAEDVSFDATVNAKQISLQDMIELTLTVHGGKGDLAPMTLPLIDGFDGRYVGPATRYMIVNGVSSSERSFVYNLFPSKVGHFKIPSIEVTLEGKAYSSQPIDIEVLDQPVNSAVRADVQEADVQQSINDKVLMKALIENKEVYVGEKTPLAIKIYVNGLSMQLAGVPYLSPDGFVADTTASMLKSKEVLGGINYDLLKFDTNIYPTRSGEIKVGPLTAQGDLIYRTRETNDLFGDFFARTQTRPITFDAPAIMLKVLPLPREGQPQNFLGAVGQYEFKASVGPSSVKVGDPLTLRMSITGQGRLKNMKFPTMVDSRFKTYDPQMKDDEGGASLEQVIIPTSKDITEVPAIAFSYFDPQDKKYKTITQGPFPVKVIAPASTDEFKAFGFVDQTKVSSDKPMTLKLDQAKGFVQRAFNQMMSVVTNLFFWIFILIILVGWIAFRMWQEFQHRLLKDERFARQWKADAKAKELLKNTKSLLDQDNSKEFYSSLYKTLNDYLADKMHLPLASLSWELIESSLKARSMDVSKLQVMKDLFERCDLVRFASVKMSKEQMSQDFAQLEELMNDVPKLFK